ncbi:hypothetical protein BCR34DRAFT_485791 [Clohesyomyces aquaticus]|uniref:BTB domain-containing protein n=1 Tax=Clohesyomyces aquaticus TaxID=1231657 RepID=A0A1Y1ZJE7_9PLEO|nr:hypothetical protein BCR34DRAFT_485791 [Clohesyomyces aquaticus]
MTNTHAGASHHSGFFRRACRTDTCKEGQESKVFLRDCDSEIFALFVDFIFYGEYTDSDDLYNWNTVRDSVKAGVLSDFLQADGFRIFAMRKLPDVFTREVWKNGSGSNINPGAIEFVCQNCEPGDALYDFFMDVTTTFWPNKAVVIPENSDELQWSDVFQHWPGFRDALLLGLSNTGDRIKYLDEYMVPRVEQDVQKQNGNRSHGASSSE